MARIYTIDGFSRLPLSLLFNKKMEEKADYLHLKTDCKEQIPKKVKSSYKL
jgi:hypothetical protein